MKRFRPELRITEDTRGLVLEDLDRKEIARLKKKLRLDAARAAMPQRVVRTAATANGRFVRMVFGIRLMFNVATNRKENH